LVVEEVMTKAVHVATATTPLDSAARLMSENGVGALPVLDGHGHVIGLLSAEDLSICFPEENEAPIGSVPSGDLGSPRTARPTVKDAMSAPVPVIRPTASLPQAAKLMRRRRAGHVVVVDADGHLRGIVSRGDLRRVSKRRDGDIVR
jgi:CBS domain-containing protein